MPSDKGTYAILIHIPRSKYITIGKLGRFYFHYGAYVYVGSAFGSGGLRSRLNRHISGSVKRHWHIDYLLKYGEVRAYYYLIDTQQYECKWVQSLLEISNPIFPIPGFGSSDCTRCPAHLISFIHPKFSGNVLSNNESLAETIGEVLTEKTDLPPDKIQGLQICQV
jgi:Uri superfamily endonuclease